MRITALLKKLAETGKLTVAEKNFLLANKDILSAEQVTAAEGAEEEVEEEEEEDGVDEKSLAALVSKSVAEQVEAAAEQIAASFAKGLETARAKAFAGDAPAAKKDVSSDTKAFMTALFGNDTASLKAISGASSTVGGYLVPDELRAEILRIAETQYGLARREMRYLPFTGPGNSRRIPALATSVSVTWTDEAVEKTSTAPTFGVVTQTLKKLAAIVPMTEEILEDSTIDIVALVAQLFAEAVAKEEDIQFFRGTGTPWTGVLYNGSVNVRNISGTNPNAVQPEDLLDLIDAVPSDALQGSKFYMHRSVMSVLRGLRDGGTGMFILQQPTAPGQPATMWGYEVVTSDAFVPVTTTGNSVPFILFGNLQRAAIFGDKQQLRVKMLDQATVANAANNGYLNLAQRDMMAVRIVERVGYVLALPQAVAVLKTQA